jgi:DNA-binding LytR/AlgR family response regulator
MIRILLADDEPVALERLELAITCIPDAELVGTARNGRQALALIRQLKPDVAVLDIQMPGKDGFAVIDAIGAGDHIPEIVFVTAFHEHAVQAFEVQAIDYLLKPVPFDRFREAIDRARARLLARKADARFAELQQLIASLQSAAADGQPRRAQDVWVRTRDGLVRVELGALDLIEAEGDYVSLHVGERAYLFKDTMAGFESRLDPAAFLRVHRSTIVNIARVKRLCRSGTGRPMAELECGRCVRVGPSYERSVLDALNATPWRGPRKAAGD